MTPEIMKSMIGKWKKGEQIHPGPQNGKRKNSEGPLGRTTLKDLTRKSIDRDFQKDLKAWEAEKAKKTASKK